MKKRFGYGLEGCTVWPLKSLPTKKIISNRRDEMLVLIFVLPLELIKRGKTRFESGFLSFDKFEQGIEKYAGS